MTFNVIHAVEPIDGAPVEAPGTPTQRAVRILEAVIRRWPAGAYETRELRRAVALLAGEPRSSTVWEPKTAMNELEPEVTP